MVTMETFAESEARYQAGEARHRARSAALARELCSARRNGLPAGGANTAIHSGLEGAEPRHRLDVRAFRHVLHIDPERLTADVEGMATYEALVDETLGYGLLPAVVPHGKAVMPGATSGLGIAASSFRHGLARDSIRKMEILTGTGDLVECSAECHPELFFAVPHAAGTLGCPLRLTVRLVPAAPYVYLTHTRFRAADVFIAYLAHLSAEASADFVEGAIFGPGGMYTTEALFAEGGPEVSDYTSPGGYGASIQRHPNDWLTTRGYVRRWETAAGWHDNPADARPDLASPAWNSRAGRCLLRFSRKLLPHAARSVDALPEVALPIARAAEFCQCLLAERDMPPVWVCPFRTGERAADPYTLAANQLWVHFGFRGEDSAIFPAGRYHRLIERAAAAAGGVKVSGEWAAPWSVQDQARYDWLKRTYDPDGVFPSLHAACMGQQ